MMQDHLDRTRTETAAIRTQVDKARKVLEGLGSLDLSSFKMQGEEGSSAAEGNVKAVVVMVSQTEEEKLEAAALEREAAAWATADALIF